MTGFQEDAARFATTATQRETELRHAAVAEARPLIESRKRTAAIKVMTDCLHAQLRAHGIVDPTAQVEPVGTFCGVCGTRLDTADRPCPLGCAA